MLADSLAAALTSLWKATMLDHAENVGALTIDAFSSLNAWNDADVAAYAAEVVGLHTSAKTVAVRATSSYLRQLTGVSANGLPAELVPVRVPDPRVPFTAMWRAMKGGATSFDDALELGRSTAETEAKELVFRASRQTGDQWAARSGAQVVGWRRVPTGSTCEWCAMVATQRYRSSESADFGHHACDCATIPIIGTRDPGRYINEELAANLDTTISTRIDASRAVSSKLTAADNAVRRRDEALAELGRETDPERIARLEGRARKWDNKAASYRAAAASEQIPAPPKPAGHTGYVDDSGNPAPRPDRTVAA